VSPIACFEYRKSKAGLICSIVGLALVVVGVALFSS
jgi:hypothetical protein